MLRRVAGGSILSTIRARCSLKFLTHLDLRMASSSSGAELAEFSSVLSKAKKITVLTGAGISAESGIPTFRGAGGLWRTWSAMELATPQAFAADPSLVWEFYHYRRCVVANSTPNMGHYALSMLQQQCENEGKNFTVITQGAPDPDTKDARIPVAELPHCRKCNGLLRPHLVWFGECLDPAVLDRAENALINCDLLLVVGTSAVVQPAAGFAPIVQGGGGVVAEFNIEDTPISRSCRYKFHGPSSKTLPQALGMSPEDLSKHRT